MWKKALWLLGACQLSAAGALSQTTMNHSNHAAVVRSSAVVPAAPRTFGTTADSLVRVGSMEFQPFDSSATYDDLGNGPATLLSRFPTSVTGLQALAHLPSGALLTGLELDYCDTNDGEDVALTAYVLSKTGPVLATLAGPASTGDSSGCNAAFVDLSASNTTIDNGVNQLVLYASFGSFDGTNAISGAIVYYRLQVSPAPGQATFNDVPTSDFAFQYVEALAASGITGGCGGGNYCPDSFVTRRQMAIFIAKALGLQWP